MMKRFLNLLALIIIFAGCKGSTTNDSSGIESLTGDLTGSISLIEWKNEKGYSVNLKDQSGVKVNIDGTSFSAITDTDGYWVIHNLPSRTYSITFSKDDFDTMRTTSFSFLGGGTVLYGDVFLSVRPKFELILDAATTFPDPKDSQNINGANVFGHAIKGMGRTARIVFSRDKNFNVDENTDNSQYFDVYISQDSTISPYASRQDIRLFYSFDTLYIAAFPANTPQNYYDVKKRKNVAVGLGKQSNVLQIIKK